MERCSQGVTKGVETHLEGTMNNEITWFHPPDWTLSDTWASHALGIWGLALAE